MNNNKFKVGDLVYLLNGAPGATGFIKDLELGSSGNSKYHKALITFTNGRSFWYPTSFFKTKS